MQPDKTSLLDEIERRFIPLAASKLELRKKDGDKVGLEGYAAKFNERSERIHWFFEELEPGCFANCLKRSDLDTVALFNHNPDLVLARHPGTLRLKEDSTGLWCEMDLIDTQVARDVRANVEAGIIYQMSFAFTVRKAVWVEEVKEGRTIEIRKVQEVDMLYDVSPVTYPAYKATSISARSREFYEHERTSKGVSLDMRRRRASYLQLKG